MNRIVPFSRAKVAVLAPVYLIVAGVYAVAGPDWVPMVQTYAAEYLT